MGERQSRVGRVVAAILRLAECKQQVLRRRATRYAQDDIRGFGVGKADSFGFAQDKLFDCALRAALRMSGAGLLSTSESVNDFVI